MTFRNSESRAITKYIAYEYADKGTQLIYQDPKKMAITSVWMEVEALQYDKIATTLGMELGYKPVVLVIDYSVDLSGCHLSLTSICPFTSCILILRLTVYHFQCGDLHVSRLLS